MATYADISEPWLSGDSRIDALLFQWPHWQYETPSDSAIYYTFSTTEGNQNDGFFQPTNISSFSAAQEAAARQALADAAAVTGIQFVEVANGTLADIHFANGDLVIDNARGQMSGSSGGQGGSGRTLLSYDANAYIYLDSNEYAHFFTNPAPGTEGYQILLHELGHALGLKHPHEGDIRLAAAEDNTGNTVMSYNWSGAPKSDYQAYDVDALQWWYGTDGLGGVSYGGTQTMTLNGTTGADRLAGGGGSDTMNGSAGNDTLIGGGGNDVIDGGAGADSMDGGLGADMYYASTGDVLTDAGGYDVVFSDISWTLAAGFEELEFLGSGNVVGTGNSADNVLWASWGNSTLIGGAGDDELHGRASTVFQGGPGNDFIVADFGGDDRFVFAEAPGAANFDLIFHFGNGADKIVLDPAAHSNLGPSGQFTAGDARFFAGPGANSGQDPTDRVVYNTSTGQLWYDSDGSGAGAAQLIARMEPIPTLAATDIIVAAANPGVVVNGSSGADTLSGTAGDDTLNGLGGNDLFLAGSTGGNDVINGGAGLDSIEFKTRATSAIVVDFAAGTITGGSSGTISFTSVERILTGDFNDTLIGNAARQTLTGQGGSDTIWGAGGTDTLWSGSGTDAFVFREMGTANADLIRDFASGSDKIVLDATVMSALGASGNFAAGDARFVANSTGTAQDASDRIIYETDTRQIWYDADGNGTAATRQLIATLQVSATLVATDVVVEGGSGGGSGTIVGTEGDDTLTGTSGDDTIDGRGGNDTLVGLEGADLLIGGDGNDVLDAFFSTQEGAVDTLNGGLGDDVYQVHSGDVILTDPGGIDLVIANNADWTLGAGLENLDLFDTVGADFNGTGNELDNIILGATEGGAIFGLGGNDRLVLRIAQNSGRAEGGDGNDTLLGGDSTHSSTNSILFGDAGDDELNGGELTSTLSGGLGADRFVFDAEPGDPSEGHPFDRITDFETAVDTIRLDATVMPALGTSGRFSTADGRFAANSTGTALDSSDRVIYNSSTGELWYDADGSGAGAPGLIVTLEGAASLTASDIEVVNGSGSSGQVINGTSGDDTLTGTAGDDTIDGMAGNDVLRGFEGADSLRGGAGNDTLWGFWELSEFESDFAADTLEGGLGDDEYNVNDDGDLILADPGGIDTVVAWVADWTLDAGLENLELESLVGNGTGNEVGNRIAGAYEGGMLVGLAGSDTLIARGSENGTRLDGGAGVDTLVGAIGVDAYLFTVAPGAANADEIAAFDSGDDRIVLDGAVHASSGPSGTFAAGDARFWSSGTGVAHDADDRVIYHTGTGELWYDADGNGAGARQLIATLQGAPALAASDIEVINGTTTPGAMINGTSGNDTLTGTAGDDTINGLGGNDLFLAGSTGGNDVIDGGAGLDSIEFKERATSAVQVDFVAGTITGGSSGTITFTSIERILTGNFNDTLTGNGASQTLTGQGGSDTIWGAGGVDTLWSGTGTDAFVFREMGTANADLIRDFASGSDKVHLDDAAFAAIGAMGNFASADARFKANSSGTATDTNDRVVFNTSTGQLYYDADGSGSGAGAQLIATVQAGAAVIATDIVVI